MSAITTTEQAPQAPTLAAPVLPPTADPTLVPQHTNFAVAEPILRESLDRVDAIAIRMRNATDTLLEKKPDAAAKFALNELRAEKLRLEIISKYADMALEARKVVSTDKPGTTPAPGTQILNQGNLILGNLPPEIEQMYIQLLGRKPQPENPSDVSASSLSL